MIIGNGNIAKVLKDRDDLIFFASGVSDSSCKDKNEYDREFNLLKQQDKNIHLVYFSNLGIYYKNDIYTNHKIKMEDFIRNNFTSYTIVRIEVCEWVNNKTTILNVFKKKLKNNESINIMNTFRYVLSLEEFLYWIDLIIVGRRNEMNILGRKLKISEIVNEIKLNKL
jgi:UDP-2-acetamido-2,6-beta-L-arabino-hexul-4-ose reductase